MKDHVNLFGDALYFDGLLFTPVKMEYYLPFMSVIDVLRIKKNRIPDIKVIRMKYLDFLFGYSQEDKSNEKNMKLLFILLRLCLTEEQFKTIEFRQIGENYLITYVDYKDIEKENPQEQTINADRFEELRRFILGINGIKDISYEISQEVEELLEKARIEKQRMENPNGLKLTIEDMIDCYHVWAGFTYQQIKEEPIYKFMKNINRMVMIENYNINKSAEMSGNVKFKKEIEHWLKHIETSEEYDDVKIPLDKFIQDFNQKVST
jgi:hypothetical protein